LNIEKPALTEIVPPEDNSNATVICNDYLSVRAQPSTTAERIFTLPPGARIEVVQAYYNSTFHMINFGDKYYYVHADYVKIDDPVPVDGVSLSDSTLTLEIGETYSLTAAISPEKATDKSLVWSLLQLTHLERLLLFQAAAPLLLSPRMMVDIHQTAA